MKRLSFFLCFVVVCAALTDELIGKTVTTTSFAPNSTTTASTTVSVETTTPSTPTPSTSISTTTTLTTTTSKPITTTPKPNPHPGVWEVNEGNLTCILVKMTVSFIIPYANNGTFQNSSSFSLPNNATSSGSCYSVDSSTQSITLKWAVNENVVSKNSLTLMFKRNTTSNSQFYLGEVNFQIYPDHINFPNASTVEYIEGRYSDSLYETKINNSYHCNTEETIFVRLEDGTNQTAAIHFSRVQFEAFHSEDGDKFSKAIDCPADGMLTSDIVPIAVGCALAALVVVVLIAYLIGRRRARQRGYQSV